MYVKGFWEMPSGTGVAAMRPIVGLSDGARPVLWNTKLTPGKTVYGASDA